MPGTCRKEIQANVTGTEFDKIYYAAECFRFGYDIVNSFLLLTSWNVFTTKKKATDLNSITT